MRIRTIVAAVTSLAPLLAQAGELPERPVLPYLAAHAGLLEATAGRVELTPAELEEIRATLDDTQFALGILRRGSDAAIRALPAGSRPSIDEVRAFNDAALAIVLDGRVALRSLLGRKRWTRFVQVADELWRDERRRSEARWSSPIAAGSSYITYTVFCTQYEGETAFEMAVPDQFVKFANRDWAYESGYPDGYYGVRLTRGGFVQQDVPVWDVGPWNLDDNYWDPNSGWPRPRRLYTDLPQGKPEAEAAFYDGYNGGRDQFGRTVLNPAGCDLSPDVAATLGLAFLQNDWVQLEYKWEEISGGAEAIYDNPDVLTRGDWVVGTSAADRYGSDYLWTSTGTADRRYCAWTIPIASAGTYDVSFWWTAGSNRHPTAQLGVQVGGQLQQFTVNQQVDGGRWNSVGTFSLSSGTVRAGVLNDGPAGWVVVCDAVRVTKLSD